MIKIQLYEYYSLFGVIQGDKKLSSSILYYKQRTQIPEFYQVHMKDSDFGVPRSGRVMPFSKFCKELGMV